MMEQKRKGRFRCELPAEGRRQGVEVALDGVASSRSFLSSNSKPLRLYLAFQLIQTLFPFLFQRVFTEDLSERYCVRADAGKKKVD